MHNYFSAMSGFVIAIAAMASAKEDVLALFSRAITVTPHGHSITAEK